VANRAPIITEEWYHCYNRGVDKRTVFEGEDDCERFLMLLYLCNDRDRNTHVIDLELRHATLAGLLRYRSFERGAPLVDIGAYALMDNHLHLIVRQLTDRSVAQFMQRVFTGYTMYFNKKYERSGALFAGSYKSKHLNTDEYFKHALQYVLLNPVDLFEKDWKRGSGDIRTIEKQLRTYKYSSAPDFFGEKRPESSLVHDVRTEYFDRGPALSGMLRDAQQYYRETARQLER
jgi:putative transposase